MSRNSAVSRILHDASSDSSKSLMCLMTYMCHPATILRRSKVIVPVTASALTINGESALIGQMRAQKMWKSWITTEESYI